jgi:hypothetical protein
MATCSIVRDIKQTLTEKGKQMKRLVLKNKFHNTEAIILAPEGYTAVEAYEELDWEASNPDNKKAQRRLKRIDDKLCGVSGCCCVKVTNG